jgi:hypothetical protein
MGTNYKARLQRWGRNYDAERAEAREQVRAGELLRLQEAWSMARTDVKCEFMAMTGLQTVEDAQRNAGELGREIPELPAMEPGEEFTPDELSEGGRHDAPGRDSE